MRAMSQCGQVVVLNGPSSSGKTTIARALRRQAERPWLHLGIDAFVDGLDRRWLDKAVNWDVDPPTVLPIAHRLAAALRGSVAVAAQNGISVVSDDLFLDESWERDWREALAGITALFVRVDADPEDLAARERRRRDRILGLAERQAAYVHARVKYDLQLNSSRMNPDHCAAAILSELRTLAGEDYVL